MSRNFFCQQREEYDLGIYFYQSRWYDGSCRNTLDDDIYKIEGVNMGAAVDLIREYSREGNPLGLPIQEDEVKKLIDSLRLRLNASTEDLDLSPASLKRLESRLTEYHNDLQIKNQTIAEDDLVLLVREVTAYLGEFLVENFKGRWATQASSLWTTYVTIEGQWEIKKDREPFIAPSVSFVIGAEAAWTWDQIQEGEKPTLYWIYRDAKSKRLRERL